MPKLVMKFGGTTVADLERIRNVANKVKREVDRGYQVAVVVSAMAGVTNQLFGYVSAISPLHDAREYDVVVASGEQVTAGLMALALQELGVPSRSWLGWPRIFDKVIDIEECFLMDNVNNHIRNTVRSFALENNFSFYDIREHTGWLRNIIIRLCTTGELMVNICLNYDVQEDRKKLFDHLLKTVPSITTLLYTINPKWNDSIYDLTPQVYFGKGYAIEKLEEFQFKISAKSFFQTNTKQAEQLYTITRDFAALTGKEILYDLYCGTGSIGIFLSGQAKKIIGVEVIEEAVIDAKENAALNDIRHAEFFAGDVIKVCNDEFFSVHGRPDVIITDPPRAGMHEKLVHKLLEIAAPSIVYVSCNRETQARHIALLSEKYSVGKIQQLEMFPHKTSCLVGGADTLKRMQDSQSKYFREISEARYDHDYFRRRQQVGFHHQHIGLPPSGIWASTASTSASCYQEYAITSARTSTASAPPCSPFSMQSCWT